MCELYPFFIAYCYYGTTVDNKHQILQFILLQTFFLVNYTLSVYIILCITSGVSIKYYPPTTRKHNWNLQHFSFEVGHIAF